MAITLRGSKTGLTQYGEGGGDGYEDDAPDAGGSPAPLGNITLTPPPGGGSGPTMPKPDDPANGSPQGNREGPRDRPMPEPTAPGNLVGGGARPPQATPSRPMNPTPVAGGTPSPSVQPPPTFEPMRAGMSPADQTVSTIVRRGIVPGGPNQQGAQLLGKAGGLMGGGLGVPGIMGSSGGEDVSDLIANLFMMANRR